MTMSAAQPENLHAIFEQAVAAHRRNDLTEAERLYSALLQVAESPQVTCNLATVRRAQGDLDQAERLYRRAIETKGDFPAAYGGLGNVLRDKGQLDESLQAYATAIAQDGDFVDAYINAGNVLQGLGRYDEAAHHFEIALRLQPDDDETRFTLAAIRGDQRNTAPESYTRHLFDAYAERFDKHLQDDLQYRVPALLRDAVVRTMGPLAMPKSLRIADLGCGTGLCGAAVADLAASLVGVDLAPRMIAKAAQRNFFDDLVCGDIVPFLEARRAAFDLVLAGDVFIYVGDMAPALNAAQQALTAGGLFAFSVERCEGNGFVLQATARFAHAPGYVEDLAADAGFEPCLRDDIDVRFDRGAPIPGLLYVLRKP
jgi:predicted TPR repeat methyltransferase